MFHFRDNNREGCDGDGFLRITYVNKRVEKYFENYGEMRKKIPIEWVRTIKKHIGRLIAADTFGDFLKLDLGHPEALHGKDEGKWSIHVTGNVRLIIKPSNDGKSVMICEEIEMEGVVDYHGGKESWYIP